jgi:hypothetical protein
MKKLVFLTFSVLLPVAVSADDAVVNIMAGK